MGLNAVRYKVCGHDNEEGASRRLAGGPLFIVYEKLILPWMGRWQAVCR